MPAQSGNNLSISQIRDGLINPNFTTPLYVSANSFTVAGDVTSWLRPRRGLVITFQTSGVKRGAVRNVFYDSGTNKSTINVIGDSLVNEPITSVLISSSDMEGAFSEFDPNLVLYLPLEEGTGTMTKDLSGWGNHGTLVNGPTWSTGRAGKCLSFDGANDYVNCGDGVSLKIGEPLTIEVWTKRQPGTPNDVKIVGNYHPDIKGYVMQSYNGNLSFGFSNGSGHIFYNFGGDYRDGQWHHFVITKDSNYIRAYIDGNAQTPVNETRLIVPSDYGLGIGVGSNVWTGFPFNGLIDDVRIYNRALTASEIQDHYLNP